MKYIFIFFISLSIFGQARFTLEPKEGFSPEIGILVSMMEDLKNRITINAQHLIQEETDFLLDVKANRIGALIMHLAATEKYYQVKSFENRNFNKEERKIWQSALDLGKPAQKEFQNKPISYYLDIWNEVRAKSSRLLATKNDAWLKEMMGTTTMNNYWAWFHVMEHQANHMGQIAMIASRLPKRK